MKVNCAAKIPIVQQIVQQAILNFKCFGGVLNGVLISSLVYLRDGINIISWNHISCYAGVNINPHPPPRDEVGIRGE